jgi:glycosyltransferase involved in cell wall biosynthesis
VRLAIFPWGDVIEDFLDPLGLTAEDYALRMRGGWLFGYVAGLRACGIEPVIVYASALATHPRRLLHAETGAPIVLVPGRRTGGGHTTTRPSLRAAAQWARTPLAWFAQVLRAEDCAAILVQDYEHARFDALAALAAALRLPLYATFQGGDLTLSPIERRVRPWSLRLCRGLAVASARERARLAARYGLERNVQDIPNPVDTAFWAPQPRGQARAELGLAPDELVFFNHGRIDIPRKGLDVLLSAWRTVAAQRPARLVVMGSGQDREAFGRLLQDAPRVRRWLSAADAYVTLSRTEGMPVAPLEAMACALPVVASDAHGLSDLFAEGEAAGGLLTVRGEAEPAAAAMLRLADDATLRQRLGAAGRARVEARYATPIVGARLAAMLRTPAPSRRAKLGLRGASPPGPAPARP